MSLDLTTTNSAYRLGRLFSVLERPSVPHLGPRNATVRDRFYASASATPALVFPIAHPQRPNHSKTIRGKSSGRGIARTTRLENHSKPWMASISQAVSHDIAVGGPGRFDRGLTTINATRPAWCEDGFRQPRHEISHEGKLSHVRFRQVTDRQPVRLRLPFRHPQR